MAIEIDDDIPFPEDLEVLFAGPLDEDDGEELLPRRLSPAKTDPERATLQSFDRERSICPHELASALEELTTGEPVPLFGASKEFEQAALRLVDLMSQHRCPLKGR